MFVGIVKNNLTKNRSVKMKFITSRIISPNQVKSLMEIIAEKKEAQKTVKTAAVKPETKKNVTAKAPEVKEEKQVEKKQVEAKTKTEQKIKVETKQEVGAGAKEYSIKEVKAAKSAYTQKFGRVWKKLTSKAALSTEDRSFLSEYFRKYYPADYVEALIAQY